MDHAEFGTADDGEWTPERLLRANYTELGTTTEIEARCKRHLLKSKGCLAAVQNLLSSVESNSSRDYSLEIDVFDLLLGE